PPGPADSLALRLPGRRTHHHRPPDRRRAHHHRGRPTARHDLPRPEPHKAPRPQDRLVPRRRTAPHHPAPTPPARPPGPAPRAACPNPRHPAPGSGPPRVPATAPAAGGAGRTLPHPPRCGRAPPPTHFRQRTALTPAVTRLLLLRPTRRPPQKQEAPPVTGPFSTRTAALAR